MKIGLRKNSAARRRQACALWAFTHSILACLSGSSTFASAPPRDYPVKPVPFTAVHLNDEFSAPRIETNTLVTIPFAFEQCERSGRMYNFKRAASAVAGDELTNKRPP